MKIAFVKQDVYQDLYVHSAHAAADDLLFSSNGRVGPIGLFTMLGADFHIIKEENTAECRAWEKVIPHYPAEWFRMLKDKRLPDTPFPEAKFFEPGSVFPHSAYAVSAKDIDWSVYDVVISINFSVPSKIVEGCRNTLWCYMIGEANVFLDRVRYGYDVCLNQEIRGLVADRPGIVDFPYTFVSATCLETLMQNALGRPSLREGVFIEVNSLKDKEKRSASHLAPLAETGHRLRLHKQNIKSNLTELYDSKYFVKVGGRGIRGNSVIEAISCGALVLMNPAEVQHSQLLPKDSWIYSLENACEKIRQLEKSPSEFQSLRQRQRDLVQAFVVDAPMESLKNCLQFKRTNPHAANKSRGPTTLRGLASTIKRRVVGV